ncbi:MAG: DEAD/DEAH box helicase [Rikenellaceae bacterium]|nr:DEAD/DEAH box helicase [Rikenellaceae bacterium]
MTETNQFAALGLSEDMTAAVASKGFETPSPIQSLTIPALLDGTGDIIAQAQTGTGKTAAFGLPIMDRLSPAGGTVQALILVPTRELALQVTEELLSINRQKKLSISAIYGGAAITEQLRRLKKGIDIVVGTPGRILDHIRRGTLRLGELKYLVLDEADEMLNMGFIEDIEEIMSKTGPERRTMLFSATMPQRILSMAKKYMNDPQLLKVEASHLTTDLTSQIYFEVRESDKLDALTRIIDVEPEFYGIVFSRTKVGVDELVTRLLERGYAAEGLHGDVSQAQREKILKKFRNRHANILVATDVAARGIDINNLTHVINYSLPQDPESYVHRIGRTGRAGNEGKAITFISNSEMRQFGFMKKAINADIERGKIPTAQDIVTMKKARILEDLQQIVESGNYEDCSEMAAGILADHDPETALGALLKLAFKNELSENSYAEIRGFSVDRKGKSRIFIAVGRKDGYDARKMVSLLKRECGISDSKIDDVSVMEDFSFATVPYADADNVIRSLNALRKGGERPLAKKAKEKETDRPAENKPRRRTAEDSGRPKREKRAPRESFTESPARPKTAKPAKVSQDEADDNWFAMFEKKYGGSEPNESAGTGKDRGKGKAASRRSTAKIDTRPAKKVSRREAREKKGRR